MSKINGESNGATIRCDQAHRVRNLNDPTTCDLSFSEADVEFIRAMELYRRLYRRPFPTCHETLEVLHSLGYRKVAEPTPLDRLPLMGSHRATAPPELPPPSEADLATAVPRVELSQSVKYVKLPSFCHCGARMFARRLCVAHYTRARRLVQAGKATWEQIARDD